MIDIKGPAHPAHPSHNKTYNVAFLGFARAGKDTAAEVAVEEFGYERFAFADKLRECVYALNPVVGATHIEPIDSHEPVLLQEIIDIYGWDHYKKTIYGDEIRRLLQRFGTEVGRELLSDTIWVDEVDKHSGPLAITDCRFDNEYDKLGGRHTIFIRINRAGITAVNAHKSENDFSDREVDYVVDNDGTVDEFRTKIRNILKTVVKS